VRQELEAEIVGTNMSQAGVVAWISDTTASRRASDARLPPVGSRLPGSRVLLPLLQTARPGVPW
jgi:hypothetical protein